MRHIAFILDPDGYWVEVGAFPVVEINTYSRYLDLLDRAVEAHWGPSLKFSKEVEEGKQTRFLCILFTTLKVTKCMITQSWMLIVSNVNSKCFFLTLVGTHLACMHRRLLQGTKLSTASSAHLDGWYTEREGRKSCYSPCSATPFPRLSDA